MTKWFDLTSLIGGVLLTISLIALGVFLIRHKQIQKGIMLLLAGIFAAILIYYGITTQQS